MIRSPLWGRRIHIAGSIHADPALASPAEVETAQAFLKTLVRRLVRLGATFVIPLDADKRHDDGRPVCFDWTIWEAMADALDQRPSGAVNPLAIAVRHHKSEAQLYETQHALWDRLRSTAYVEIDSAARWNMASKRMETAARRGDLLLAIGGGEGVEFLGNLYHAAGKPVVPLNFQLGEATAGALKLFNLGQAGSASKLFEVGAGRTPDAWLNHIDFGPRATVDQRVEDILALLGVIERPRAFAVRLLAPSHPDYADVDTFFEGVVRPVAEGVFGFRLTVIDGKAAFGHPRVDQEIFEKLHRSGVVIADITGERPNCFIELGYALGRCHPTLMTARAGAPNPFDTYTVPSHFWSTTGSLSDRRTAFETYWNSAVGRPPIVSPELLIP